MTTAAPQHIRALAAGNEIRLARAQLKREIKAGEVNICDLIIDPPSCLKSMRLGDLLRAQHRWAITRTRRTLHLAQLSELKRLDSLTSRQRLVLVDVLGGPE